MEDWAAQPMAVHVVGVKIAFLELVVLLVKIALAMIPALFIIAAASSLFWAVLGSLLGQQRIEIDFLDAVGLATLFDDRKNFDVPVKVVGQCFPIARELAFFAERAGRGVHHQVKRWGDLFQSSKHTPEQGR